MCCVCAVPPICSTAIRRCSDRSSCAIPMWIRCTSCKWICCSVGGPPRARIRHYSPRCGPRSAVSRRACRQQANSTLGHVDGETPLRGLLVDGGHVTSSLTHGRDDLVQRHLVRA